MQKLNWQPENADLVAVHCVALMDWDKCVQLGAPAVDPLIFAPDDLPQGAAEALGRIGDPRAVTPLIEKLGILEYAWLRTSRKVEPELWAIVGVLKQIGTEEAQQRVLAFAQAHPVAYSLRRRW